MIFGNTLLIKNSVPIAIGIENDLRQKSVPNCKLSLANHKVERSQKEKRVEWGN